MSAKSPLLLTLSGANSATSTSPAQSSRCLIRSQDRSPPPPEPPQPPPFVRTSTHEPFSLKPFRVNFRSPRLSASSTSSTSGVQVPRSQSMTIPAPYPDGITPSNSPYSIG